MYSISGDPNGSASFSMCKGRGLRGWIKAFNESFVIEPKILHYDKTSIINRKLLHKLDDEYLVYKTSRLNTTGWSIANGCGHEYHDIHHGTTKNINNNVRRSLKSTANTTKSNNMTTRWVQLLIVNDPV